MLLQVQPMRVQALKQQQCPRHPNRRQNDRTTRTSDAERTCRVPPRENTGGVGAPHQCSRAYSRLLRGGFDRRTCRIGDSPWSNPAERISKAMAVPIASINEVFQEAPRDTGIGNTLPCTVVLKGCCASGQAGTSCTSAGGVQPNLLRLNGARHAAKRASSTDDRTHHRREAHQSTLQLRLYAWFR